ncbi:uncharacterized protein LOC115731069 [Rhodamnia argentea]|uniref:Uncharacterized protein LOC115731069 n=1 Tax=Rhodamnia argentea TaxID=178133 RepID=A0ABM3HBM3_9MYRT|nr:uncharacterized protein LOC115731069 [Rhodamnia argentea]
MATQPSEEQGNSSHAEQPADVRVSVGSAPSQSRGASEILQEEADGQYHYYRPLLQAAFKGDWESAKRFFERDSASKMAKITSKSQTVLHLATLSEQDQFVESLIELLSQYPEVLETVDCNGRTALHNSVMCGRIRMVEALVRSNPNLTQLADNEGRVPLGISAKEASMHKEIAWFLAKSTTDNGPSQPFSSQSAIDTILDLTHSGHHDITLYLVKKYPHLISMRSTTHNISILDMLARMESHFPSGTRLSVLEALIYKCIPVDLNYEPTDKSSDPALQCLTRSIWNAAKIVVPIIKRTHEVTLGHMVTIELAKQVCIAISRRRTTEITNFLVQGDTLGEATARGITEIMKQCIQFFPELIWMSPDDNRLAKHILIAVHHRQERIVRLFFKESSTNQLSFVRAPLQLSATIMAAATQHQYAAAEYYSSFNVVTNVVGAAFQMQRELQWYKGVESRSTRYLALGYFRGKTFWVRFVEQHQDLLKSGGKWMKDTANSCMLVSTLIATVLFALAFTVPGGNDDKTGVPLLLGQDSVLVFAISDALGLFSSVMAILLFLAILTSRYEAQDFLYLLPKKIIMGLCFLFLSLAFMLVAFTATLTIVLDKRMEWVLIPITLLASFPVALFVGLQLPLLLQMVKSTYGPSIFRPEGIWDGVKYTEQDR